MVTRTSFLFLLSEMIEVKLFFALVWLIQSAAVALWRWSTINIGLLWVMRGCFHIKFRLFPLQFIQRYAFWTVNVKTSKSWSWNFIPSAFPLQNISYANSLRPNTKQKWCMHIFVKFHRYSVANSIYYYRNTETSALLLLWLIQCSETLYGVLVKNLLITLKLILIAIFFHSKKQWPFKKVWAYVRMSYM